MASFEGLPQWFRALLLEHCPWVQCQGYMSKLSSHRFIDVFEMFSGKQHLSLACESVTLKVYQGFEIFMFIRSCGSRCFQSWIFFLQIAEIGLVVSSYDMVLDPLENCLTIEGQIRCFLSMFAEVLVYKVMDMLYC